MAKTKETLNRLFGHSFLGMLAGTFGVGKYNPQY